jgi:hypothetical protein
VVVGGLHRRDILVVLRRVHQKKLNHPHYGTSADSATTISIAILAAIFYSAHYHLCAKLLGTDYGANSSANSGANKRTNARADDCSNSRADDGPDERAMLRLPHWRRSQSKKRLMRRQ